MTRIVSTLLVMLVSLSCSANAQTFSYSLQSGSETYNALSEPTLLSNGSDWNNTTYKTAIGFSFPFAGSNFDSVRIEPNGFLVFDNGRNYAFSIFKGLYCKQDTSDTWSQVSYTQSENILKLQFKNVGFYPTDKRELFNFQVWLYSNGDIEVRTGPNPNNDYISTEQTTLLGLINMNRNTSVSAYIASGSPEQPTGSSLSSSDELQYLNPVPANGKVYTFSPSH